MYCITGVTTHNALSTLNARRSYTIKTDRTGFVFVMDSRSGWQGGGAARREGRIVVHAPREPNRARLPREREARLKVVLELVTKKRRSYHRTGRPL